MVASGRSSSEEDMTIDVKESFNDLDTRIVFAKAVLELKGLEKKEKFLKVWSKAGGVFTIEQCWVEMTGRRDNCDCGGWRVDVGLQDLWKVGDGGAKEVTIVEWSGKKRRPSRGRVYAGKAAVAAAASGGKAAREQYRRKQAARRVGFTARILGGLWNILRRAGTG